MSSASKPTISPLTHGQLMEGLRFYFERNLGISSEGMFLEAMGLKQRARFFEARPWDSADMKGAEMTYKNAPAWLRERMLPRLTWYRELAELGFPAETPTREDAAA